MSSESFYEIKENITEAAFGKNEQCFLLIDASLEKYQSNDFIRKITEAYSSYPVIFRQNELNGALPLFLLPINAKSTREVELFHNSISHSLEELKSEKLDAGEGRSVCAWISSELTGQQMADQIALSAVQSIEFVGDILIRYFDPSVFGLLMPVLDSWQRQQLLSNVNTWSYIDGDGIAQIENGDGECTKKLNFSLGLTQLNLSKMSRVLVINKILRRYRAMNLVDKLSEREAAKLLHPALDNIYASFSPSDDEVIDFGIDILLT